MNDGGGGDGVPEGFLKGEPTAISFIESSVSRALAGRSLNLGDARADVHQETLRRLIHAFRSGQFRGDATLTTYVYKVAHGAAIDHWRSVRRRREDQGDEHPHVLRRSTPALQNSAIESTERRQLVTRLLVQLGPPCRELLARIYFDEATHATIGASLGKTEGAVKVQAHRCREQASRLMREMTGAPLAVTRKDGSTPNVSMSPDFSFKPDPQP